MASRIFVVFGGQRTGSTLIATRLNSHPHITCHSEVLLPWVDSEPSLRGWLAAHGYPQFFRLAPPVRYSFLNSLISADQRRAMDAMGLKLMYDQVSLLPKISYAYPPIGRFFNDLGVLRWLKENDALIIHALRRNHLKTVVSHARAAQTSEFHRRGEDLAGRNRQFVLPVRGLKARLNRIDMAERAARTAIRDLEAIEVWYEDYVGGQGGEVDQRICAALGQNVPEGGLHSPLAKVSSDNLREAITNYDDVASVLAGTRFEAFLEP